MSFAPPRARALWLSLLLWLLVSPTSPGVPAQAARLGGELTHSADLSTLTWSPRGDSILFTRPAAAFHLSPNRSQEQSDLYRLDLASGSSTLLLHNAAAPAFDPSAEQVAYLSFFPDASVHLGLLDLAARTVRDLGPADGAYPPHWTTTGALLYVREGETWAVPPGSTAAASRLWRSSALSSPRGDWGAVVAAGGLGLLSSTASALLWPTSPGDRLSPELAWSSDGDRLAFVVSHLDATIDLYTIRRDGSGLRALAHGRQEYFYALAPSPTGSALYFLRSPTGTEVLSHSELWRVDLASGALERLSEIGLAQPRLSPDGRQLAFLRAGDLILVPAAALSLAPTGLPNSASKIPTSQISNSSPISLSQIAILNSQFSNSSQLSPPPTIRIKHSANNPCRSEPVGQIDVLDLETYVKRVVPNEMSPSWPAEALKTQAVAARTYAWYQVLGNAALNYDVYDWTESQAMCNTQFPQTDSAAEATRGQYVAYGGAVILAQYSADNGDPTSTFVGVPYLLAVDDPVSFGDNLYGHGHGMSQDGAQRWALQYAWNYQQILLHYYSNVTLEAPFGPSPDITAPLGSLIQPLSNRSLTSNRAYLLANASDNSSTLASVDFTARLANGVTTTVAHLTNPSTRWETVWDLTGQPDQGTIVVTPTIRDLAGNTFSGNPVSFLLDRQVPTGALAGPNTTAVPTVTLALTATDTGPAGLTSMAFSNNWIWEGENQLVEQPGGVPAGVVVSDTAALNGIALRGQPGVNPAGAWYGPYTSALTYGQKYRAYFRLRTDNVITSTELALLDVVVNGGSSLLGLKRLRGTDFATTAYQEFYVDFNYSTSIPVATNLEFRVAYRAVANLWLDRILIVSYPTPFAPISLWALPGQSGRQTVIAKVIDGAGNVSADLTTLITETHSLALPVLFRSAP